jgi:hypothetical protein
MCVWLSRGEKCTNIVFPTGFGAVWGGARHILYRRALYLSDDGSIQRVIVPGQMMEWVEKSQCVQ